MTAAFRQETHNETAGVKRDYNRLGNQILFRTNMKIYNHIEVENQQLISDKLYDYLVNHTEVFTDKMFWNDLDTKTVLEYVPELSKVLHDMQLEPKDIAAIYAEPYMQGGVHVDDDPDVRLLWPVRNCLGSLTKFFHAEEKDRERLSLPNGKIYIGISDPSKCEQIGEFELITPVVFDPNIPHGIYTNMNCSEPRITVTIRLHNPPVHLLD